MSPESRRTRSPCFLTFFSADLVGGSLSGVGFVFGAPPFDVFSPLAVLSVLLLLSVLVVVEESSDVMSVGSEFSFSVVVAVVLALAELLLSFVLLDDFFEQPARKIARRRLKTVRVSLLFIYEKISFGSVCRDVRETSHRGRVSPHYRSVICEFGKESKYKSPFSRSMMRCGGLILPPRIGNNEAVWRIN